MRVILKVREIAEKKGLNAAQLGRRANLSNAAIYGIWNGTTTDPGIKTLARLATVLEVETHELYEVIGDNVYEDRMSLAAA
jgi:transcriptional regulator with XRE-family HTH domain